MDTPMIGQHLNNGALIIDVRDSDTGANTYVLAFWPENDVMVPYVVWRYIGDSYVENGIYCETLERAVERLRIKTADAGDEPLEFEMLADIANLVKNVLDNFNAESFIGLNSRASETEFRNLLQVVQTIRRQLETRLPYHIRQEIGL